MISAIKKISIVFSVAFALSHSSAMAQPSFSCKKRLNSTEHTICINKSLTRLDSAMTQKYGQLYYMLSNQHRYQLRRDQKVWLDQRNSCGKDRGCIKKKYSFRTEQLRRWIVELQELRQQG